MELRWAANLGGMSIAVEARVLVIPLGGHATVEIAFMPANPGKLRLDLASSKGEKKQFEDSRTFVVE